MLHKLGTSYSFLAPAPLPGSLVRKLWGLALVPFYNFFSVSLTAYYFLTLHYSYMLNICLQFQLLAGELGLVPTKITKADKAEHIKRKKHREPQTATSKKTNQSNIWVSTCRNSADHFWVWGMSAVLFLTSGVRPASIGLGFMVQSLGTDDHRIAKMAQQVKDVLPHVPLNVITKDLGKGLVPVGPNDPANTL